MAMYHSYVKLPEGTSTIFIDHPYINHRLSINHRSSIYHQRVSSHHLGTWLSPEGHRPGFPVTGRRTAQARHHAGWDGHVLSTIIHQLQWRKWKKWGHGKQSKTIIHIGISWNIIYHEIIQSWSSMIYPYSITYLVKPIAKWCTLVWLSNIVS